MDSDQGKTTLISDEDHCDRCREGLGYPRSLHADDPRRLGNLTQGGGQLCPKCARVVYPPAATPNTPNIGDMHTFG